MYIVALGSICFSPTSPSPHLLCHRHSNAHGDNINLGDLLGAGWTKQPIWNILQKSKRESSRKRCLVTSTCSIVTVLVAVGSWSHLQLGKSRKGKWTAAGNLLWSTQETKYCPSYRNVQRWFVNNPMKMVEHLRLLRSAKPIHNSSQHKCQPSSFHHGCNGSSKYIKAILPAAKWPQF